MYESNMNVRYFCINLKVYQTVNFRKIQKSLIKCYSLKKYTCYIISSSAVIKQGNC